MKEKHTVIRLKVLLALVAVLAGLVFHSFTSASAAPPDPTPTFEARTEFEESQFLTDSPISPADAIATGVVTFYAAADTQVLQGHSTTNYGINSTMRAGYDACPGETPGVDRGLVRFDLSHVPPGTTINSARLDLYFVGSCGYSGQYLAITPYQITGGWQEEGVTWNTQPSLGSGYGSVSILHDSAWGWYSFDITNLVRNWVSGTSNYGIMLRGPETSTGWRGFGTKGAGRYTYGPRLIVDLVLPPPTLSAATSPMEFTNDAAGPITQTQELVVQNLGEDILDWSASESASWLSLGKTNGTAVGFTSPDTIRVSVDRSGLSPGHYVSQIQITSNTPGVQGSPQFVDVTFDLVEELPRVYLPVMLKGRSGGAPPRDVVALMIGISEYENMGLGGQTSGRAGAPGSYVMHSREDAVGVDNTVSEKGCLSGASQGGVASQNLSCCSTKMLLDSWATKEAIRQAIVYWLDEREDENTTVLIFFSGHGMYAQDTDGDEADGYDEFLVPYDVQCTNCDDDQLIEWLPETAIRDDELDVWLGELESCRIAVIVDSCFSGGIGAGAVASGRGLLSSAGLGTAVADLQVSDSFSQDVNGPCRLALMASAADQGSWEFSALEHGVFSHYLIEALSSASADTNHNGWVSAEEAFNYLASRVDSYVLSNTGYHQNPQIWDGVVGEVDITQP